MRIFNTIRDELIELLDVDGDDIVPETYVVRDLGAESIDFLELAVVLNERFSVEIVDDDIFLRNLRLYLMAAEEKGISPREHLERRLPFLPVDRIDEILLDLEGGPVLTVKDLVFYVDWQLCQSETAA